MENHKLIVRLALENGVPIAYFPYDNDSCSNPTLVMCYTQQTMHSLGNLTYFESLPKLETYENYYLNSQAQSLTEELIRLYDDKLQFQRFEDGHWVDFDCGTSRYLVTQISMMIIADNLISESSIIYQDDKYLAIHWVSGDKRLVDDIVITYQDEKPKSILTWNRAGYVEYVLYIPE